jgi:ElaB/YqjD/DUF883 family membrane-anchored ribosome-binding protein
MMTDKEFQEYLLKRLDKLADSQEQLAASVAGLQVHSKWWGAVGGAVMGLLIGLFNAVMRRS